MIATADIKTKKAAKEAGLRTYDQWLSRRLCPTVDATGITVKGTVFYSEAECEVIRTKTGWSHVGRKVIEGAEPVAYLYYFIPGASDHYAHYRIADTKPKAPRQPVDYPAKFQRRYGNDIERALGDAAKGLFSLNRYAKHPTCSDWQRERIYDLKSRFIEYLYTNGYATSVGIHKDPDREHECWKCNGTGVHKLTDADFDYRFDDFDEDDFEDIEDDTCPKCDGTGIYRRVPGRTYYVFSFDIGGVRYAWHSPQDTVQFPVSVTEDSSGDLPETETKPIEISRSRLTERRKLLEWVLEQVSCEQSQVRQSA